MEILELRSPHAKLSTREGQLVVSDPGGVISRHPICATETIQIYGNPQITTQAVKECLRNGPVPRAPFEVIAKKKPKKQDFIRKTPEKPVRNRL